MWECPQCNKFNLRKWVSIWESSTCITCDKFTNGTEAWNDMQKDQVRLELLKNNLPEGMDGIIIAKNKEKQDAIDELNKKQAGEAALIAFN